MHGLCTRTASRRRRLPAARGPKAGKITRPTALALRHPLLRQFNGQRSTMKKMLALLLSAVCTLAVAETDLNHLPAPLNKSLRGNAIKSAQLDNGVLRLQMDKPAVSELVYSTFVFHNICAEQWHHPDQFAKLALAKVELLNASGQQGYAFDARGDVCVQMGQLGKKFGAFIAQRTVPCEAGVCPKHP